MDRASTPLTDLAHDLPPGYTSIHPDSLNGFGNSIGPIFIDEAGRRLAFRVRPMHLNVAGFGHGGALAHFADYQVAVVRGLIDGLAGHTPTISLSIDYIVPVPLAGLVEMQVTLVRHTRSMLFTQSILSVAGQNVGKADAIYRWYTGRSGGDEHAE